MSNTTTAWEFYPGEKKTLEINLTKLNKSYDTTEPFRITDNAARKIRVTIPALPSDLVFDNFTGTPRVTVTSAVLGQLSLTLLPADTLQMTSGSVLVSHDELGDGANVTMAVAKSAIRKIELPSV